MAGPSTATIVAMLTLNRDCGPSCVEWAQQQIASGIETSHLLRLAAAEPPFNFFEIKTRAENVIDELGVGSLSRDEAIAVLAADIFRRSETREPLPASVDKLRTLYIEENFADGLLPFYILSHALESIRDTGEQHYVEAADEAEILNRMRIAVRSLLEAANQLELRVQPSVRAGTGEDAPNDSH